MSDPTSTSRVLSIFIIHASHNLTNHAEHGDGLVAWGFIRELAERGHRVYALTDCLDVNAPIPSNLTLLELPKTQRSSIAHYIRYIIEVRRIYNKTAKVTTIDVAHQMNPVVRGLSLALVGTQTPVVLGTFVGDWKSFHKQKRKPWRNAALALNWIAKGILDILQQLYADELIIATPYAISRIPLAAAMADRIHVLNHGVDTELFSPHRKFNDPETDQPVILYVGAVRANKGVGTLIDAFSLIAGRFPSAQLVFIGRGDTERWQNRLRELGLHQRSRFLGTMKRHDVSAWMRISAVLCAPSFGEPYGQNILEAMASGIPVVGTSEGGHRYLLDSTSGYQVYPGDAIALAESLSKLLADREKAETMGRENRASAQRRFSWSGVTDQLELIYQHAMLRRRQRR